MNRIMTLCLVGLRPGPKLDTALKRFALPLLILILLSSLSYADIYKCTSDSGVVTYSDEPCGKNAVHAFDEYVMSIDDAASRDIITPSTDRSYKYDIISAMIPHAKRIAYCIFPDKEFLGVILSKTSWYASKNDLCYSVNMGFGSKDPDSGRVIKVFYEGRMIDGPIVRLAAIKIYKGHKPCEPISMNNLKTFRKIKEGEWEYQK